MLAKNRAAASLSRAGTMVWFKMIVIQLLGVIERTIIGYNRSNISLLELGCLDLQAQKPT
jgi:hypothetical protein